MIVISSLFNRWKRIARRIGDLQARIIFTIIYFFITWPFALIVKWKQNPFDQPNKRSNWHEIEEITSKYDSLKKQY